MCAFPQVRIQVAYWPGELGEDNLRKHIMRVYFKDEPEIPTPHVGEPIMRVYFKDEPEITTPHVGE